MEKVEITLSNESKKLPYIFTTLSTKMMTLQITSNPATPSK